MHREGNIISFESTDDARCTFDLPDSIPVTEVPELFDMICETKNSYGLQLQKVAVAAAYDDQPLLRMNAERLLTHRFHNLQLLARDIVDLAGAEIIDDALSDIDGLELNRLYQK